MNIVLSSLKEIVSNFKVLEYYGLEGLLEKKPVTLYHGTTKLFKKFDLKKSRKELVDKFYGVGIFLTPSKRVAYKYTYANRNIGFDKSIINDLANTNKKAAEFLENLYYREDAAWDDYDFSTLEKDLKVDPNTLADISAYIIGSKKKPISSDEINLFNQQTGMPAWVYDALDMVGIDSYKYRPKIYTVNVVVNNTLVTDNKNDAANAHKDGYDCVVYYGDNLVESTPEVAVYNPNAIKIRKIELAD